MDELYKAGRAKGFTDAQINKALKMFKSGKFDDSKLTDTMFDNNETIDNTNLSKEDLKNKLKDKIKNKRNMRLTTYANEIKTKNNEQKLKIEEEKKKNKEKTLNQKHKIKMKKLKQKYGIINDDYYLESLNKMAELKSKSTLTELDKIEKNRLQNILDLYVYLNKANTNNLENNDEDNLADISDISDTE